MIGEDLLQADAVLLAHPLEDIPRRLVALGIIAERERAARVAEGEQDPTMQPGWRVCPEVRVFHVDSEYGRARMDAGRAIRRGQSLPTPPEAA